MNNNICDVEGVLVGQAQTQEPFATGVTVLLCETPCRAGISVLGGAPGVRDTELLKQGNSVDKVDAILLSGGSAFGLDAAGGVMAALAAQGRGLEVRGNHVPIVPSAILFDLPKGGFDVSRYLPHRDLGYQATQAASNHLTQGSFGAGMGALAGCLKGGIGSASSPVQTQDITANLGALIAVNSLGQTTIGATKHFWAAPFEKADEFGGLGLPAPMPADTTKLRLKFGEEASFKQNTSIGIVATDMTLTSSQCERLAIAAQDGLARAIWPCHTPADGDCIFAISTATCPAPNDLQFMALCAEAAAVTSRAVARGVYHAKADETSPYPDWQQSFGD